MIKEDLKTTTMRRKFFEKVECSSMGWMNAEKVGSQSLYINHSPLQSQKTNM